MILPFHKYHGAGNDFILVDNREAVFHLTTEQISWLCDRHSGIGADGLMLLNSQDGYDFGMRYFNADGEESTLCGNGGRCITAFASQLSIIFDRARFLAIDGEHVSEILHAEGNEYQVRLTMPDVPVASCRIIPPTNLQSSIVNRQSSIFIHTGSPHLVIFVEDASSVDVVTEGRKLRYDPQFAPDGTNVDFVEIRQNTNLFVRTYERGVEDETLSCGTGVTAAALASVTIHQSPVTRFLIHTRGGDLSISFRCSNHTYTNICLEGPARFVFSGEVPIPTTEP